MLTATTVSETAELEQILVLQSLNLKQHITTEEKQSEGFLTMSFNLPMLQAMHELAPSVIVKNDNNKVVAYAISFLKEGIAFYPQIEPLLNHLEQTEWRGRPLTASNYYIMGQICVAKEVRGKGVFEMLYHKHRETFSKRFDCIVTEIANSNHRSLRAHLRTGFEIISNHSDHIDDWNVVAWGWDDPT